MLARFRKCYRHLAHKPVCRSAGFGIEGVVVKDEACFISSGWLRKKKLNFPGTAECNRETTVDQALVRKHDGELPVAAEQLDMASFHGKALGVDIQESPRASASLHPRPRQVRLAHLSLLRQCRSRSLKMWQYRKRGGIWPRANTKRTKSLCLCVCVCSSVLCISIALSPAAVVNVSCFLVWLSCTGE